VLPGTSLEALKSTGSSLLFVGFHKIIYMKALKRCVTEWKLASKNILKLINFTERIDMYEYI
jgi:hypothetical protein